jgi:cell division protein FtsB
MTARRVTYLLLFLLLVIHVQLWFGRGSLVQNHQAQSKLSEVQTRNAQAHVANERLRAEVNDLREGLEMVEEKARTELGMVKPNEILVQVLRK